MHERRPTQRFALPTLAHGSADPLQDGVHVRLTPSGRTIYLARRGLGILGVTLFAHSSFETPVILFGETRRLSTALTAFAPRQRAEALGPLSGNHANGVQSFCASTETPSGDDDLNTAPTIVRSRSVMSAELAGKSPTSVAVCQVDNQRSSKKIIVYFPGGQAVL